MLFIYREATHLQTRCADTGTNGGRRMPTASQLEFLKKEAKSLLKQCRAGDAAALGRIRASLPRLVVEEINLAEIQYVLAREHGYSSWPDLKQSEVMLAAPPDFSKPGSDGALPEGFNPWQWSVTYTVRPELHAELKWGEEYIVLARVLRRAPDKSPFKRYAELYERTIAIAKGRVGHLKCPADCLLDAQIRTQGWFGQRTTDFVTAYVSLGVRCIKKGETNNPGMSAPTAKDLAGPGGMTPDNTTAPDLIAARHPYELYTDADARDLSAPANIQLVSYGEYVESAESVDFGPILERAQRLARFHLSLRDSDSEVIRSKPKIVRREWFVATNPDIAVAHIYLQR